MAEDRTIAILTAERDRLRAALERIATWPDMAYHVADVAKTARDALAATPAVPPPPPCWRCGGTRTVRFGAPCPECSIDRGEWGAATPPPAR